MSTRVLSTEEAKQAITQIRTILSGQFMGSINQLETQGQHLSDPNVWDGQLATTFRTDTWPAVDKALKSAYSHLETLHNDLNQIYGNIMEAGGNAA